MSASSNYEQVREKLKSDLLHRQSVGKDALSVVISLLEADVSEEQLIEAASRLTPALYGDVTEERGLAMLCGYPICSNKLTSLNHKQKYHISARTNKVFDVSERRYFCSASCYKASKYLQSQVSDEPLWGRRFDSTIKIELLTESKKQHAVAVSDESVIIDKTTSFTETSDPTEILASELLQKLSLEEEELEKESADEKPSDGGSSDEDVNESIQSLLTRRKDQRLHTDLSNPTSALGDVDERWQGSMLNRVNHDQLEDSSSDSNKLLNKTVSHSSKTGDGLTVSGSKSSSEMNLDHTSATGKPVSGTSVQRKVSSDVVHRTGTARSAKTSAPRTVLLDCTMPAPKMETTFREEAKTPADLLVCLERLTEWFSDETRQILFTRGILSESSSAASTSKQGSADAKTSGEVEVTQPNVESVQSRQRSIVYQRLLKSFERLTAAVPEQNDVRDRLGELVKTFRLTRDNISAKPLQWSLYALVLSICLTGATSTFTIQELERLTKDKLSKRAVDDFIERQRQLLGG
ncbi:putative RNA polymerase II subunit B1 CTD phosphatase RPAP2 isoform X2 [Watersipora subatra]|uniref:putative RNA polymerase II subunit B1 CTD phosphatase RPAP2 isoform X2 n=1 Tax=Watersipora subatra TaxID=2589382 RepID=UPI00355B0639